MGPDVEDQLRRMTDEDQAFEVMLDVLWEVVSEHGDTCSCDACHMYCDLMAPRGDV